LISSRVVPQRIGLEAGARGELTDRERWFLRHSEFRKGLQRRARLPRRLHPLACRDQIAETTGAARVPYFAGASIGVDICTHPLNDRGAPVSVEFRSNRRF
jgi:hypothetical protein